MHTKRIGNIGELKVASFLACKGYSVFKELGDISKIDLITEVNGRLIKIQVKSLNKVDGTYTASSIKSGPSYKFKYTEKDIDAFAVYCIEEDKIAWIKISEIANGKSIALRVDETKRNFNTINWLKDYLDFERIL